MQLLQCSLVGDLAAVNARMPWDSAYIGSDALTAVQAKCSVKSSGDSWTLRELMHLKSAKRLLRVSEHRKRDWPLIPDLIRLEGEDGGADFGLLR